jgi:hypothetical protein
MSEYEIRLSDNWDKFKEWIRGEKGDVAIVSIAEDPNRRSTFSHSGGPGRMTYHLLVTCTNGSGRFTRSVEAIGEWLHPLLLDAQGKGAEPDDTSLFPVRDEAGAEGRIVDPIASCRDCIYSGTFL